MRMSNYKFLRTFCRRGGLCLFLPPEEKFQTARKFRESSCSHEEVTSIDICKVYLGGKEEVQNGRRSGVR